MKVLECTFKDLKSLHDSYLLLVYHALFSNGVLNCDIAI